MANIEEAELEFSGHLLPPSRILPPSSWKSQIADKPSGHRTMKQRLPLFETFAAVFAVAAVAFLTALPSIGNSGDQGEKNIALSDSLSVIRTAVFRFSMDHENLGSPLLPGLFDTNFEHQLVARSRADGSTSAVNEFEDRYYGPYLAEMPENPVNGLSNVRVMPAGHSVPVLNGSSGWVYIPDSGKIFADLAGADSRGIAYSEY